MRAHNFLIGLALADLILTVLAGPAPAMPLQSRLEVPQLSGAGPEIRAAPSGPAVKPIFDVSAAGEVVETAPPSALDIGRPLPAPSSPNLPRVIHPVTPIAAVDIFRGFSGETFQPLPGRAPAARYRAGPSGVARRQQDNLSGPQQMTLKDLVRALINKPENLALDTTVVSPARGIAPALRQGDSILSTILAVAIDKEMVEAISKVLRPSISVRGVVTFNIFGLRDIALLVAPGSNNIRLIYLGSDRSMSFSLEGPGGMSGNDNQRGPMGPGMGQATGDRENILPAVVAAVSRWLSTYVFNGFSLTVLGLISLFWYVWSLAGRER